MGQSEVNTEFTTVAANGQMDVTNVTFGLCKQPQTGYEHTLPLRSEGNVETHRHPYKQNNHTKLSPPAVYYRMSDHHLMIRKLKTFLCPSFKMYPTVKSQKITLYFHFTSCRFLFIELRSRPDLKRLVSTFPSFPI